jgi:tetratricopeptide (TPR) repeat protein
VTGDLSALTIPPTIQSLLTARLDRLTEEERAVVERASIIGRVFWWNAVSELTPEHLRPNIASGLQSLTRKELIRPDRSELGEEDAFRFAHNLVRDAAYGGIPKATRAELHERFAHWIETRMPGRAGQYEEILGYHLEQAHEALSELRLADDRVEELGKRGAAALSSAGRRAFRRGDMPAAVNLLSRACDLLPTGDPERPHLLPDLAFALLETGDLARGRKIVDETRAAMSQGGPVVEAQATLLGLWMGVFTDPHGWAEEAFREATQAIETFEAEHDESGLAKAWSLLGLVHLFLCQFADSEQAWEQASAHARAAGSEREELEFLSWVPIAVYCGPTPVEASIARCQEIHERAAGDRKAMSTALSSMGMLEAMRGRFSEARDLVTRARALLQEIGLSVWMAGPLSQVAGWVEILGGEPKVAARELEAGAASLREIGELSWLSTVAAVLAEAHYQQGALDDVEQYLRLSEESGGEEDVYTQALLRSVRAKLLARRGSVDDAERLGREAVAIAAPTDFLFLQWFALLSLGETLLVAGRADEADQALKTAVQVCEQKGFTVGADRVRLLLDSFSGSP